MNKGKKRTDAVFAGVCILLSSLIFWGVWSSRVLVQEVSAVQNVVSPQPNLPEHEERISYGNYEYQIVSETRKSIAIAKIRNYGETVVVPAKLNGYTVEGFGDVRDTEDYSTEDKAKWNVFQESDRIVKKLVLPEGITYIGDYACREMLALQEVNLPQSLLRIEDYSFHGCKALKNLKLPGKLKYIGESAFFECVLLKNWDLPTSLEMGGFNCFGGIKLNTIIARGELPDEFTSDSNVKKVILCGKLDYDVYLGWNGVYNVICRPGVKSVSCHASAKKVYIQGKKTRISDEKSPDYQIFAVAGAACMKDAKDWALDVTVCKLPKLKVTSIKKNGKNIYIWNGGKAVIKKYSYPGSGKAKLRSTKKRSLVYEISFKQKGKKTYETVKTIKKTKWFTKKKGKVRVTAMAKNYWP